MQPTDDGGVADDHHDPTRHDVDPVHDVHHLPWDDEDDHQEVYLMRPEEPHLVPGRDTPECWELLTHGQEHLHHDVHEEGLLVPDVLTLVTPVGMASKEATNHTRQVTFLAWEVVHR